jgi:hypothetical protein
MKLIIGIAIILAFVFMWSLCKVASDADDRMEEVLKERNKYN